MALLWASLAQGQLLAALLLISPWSFQPLSPERDGVLTARQAPHISFHTSQHAITQLLIRSSFYIPDNRP